jgi:hypothetical protein
MAISSKAQAFEYLGSPDNKTPSSAIMCQFREELKGEQDVILILEEI